MADRQLVTAVIETRGLHWATEKAVVEAVLGRRPGVTAVDANPVAQTATISFDTALVSIADLQAWVRDCGYHCAGQSVPAHICDPLVMANAPAVRPDELHEHTVVALTDADDAHQPKDTISTTHDAGPSTTADGHHSKSTPLSPHDAMGHGGHGGMSMAAMVRDMRNRFLVAAVLSVPILLWSPIGRDVLGFDRPGAVRAARRRVRAAAEPAGDLLLGVDLLRRRLPGAAGPDAGHDGAGRRRGRRRLAATALVVTLTGGGEVFYEAATVLTAFVLLGHWFEMRARGGANDAIRTLLELAPPMAVVAARRRARSRSRPAEVVVGDLLLVRPGRQDPGRRRSSRTATVRGRRVDGHRREPAGATRTRRRR